MLGLDPRSLALFRVLFGLALFADALAGLRGLRVFFTDDGVFPREAASHLAEAHVGLSVHFLSGSFGFAAFLVGVTATVALAFAAGLWTRAASIALFFLTLSAQIRNPLVLQGSDYIARVVLFWAMFLPLGERASIDALRSSSPEPAPRVVVSPASAGFLIQVALIYWASAAQKTEPAWREAGTAVLYVLNVPSLATWLGRAIGQHPDLCRALTFATVGIETLGPFLLFVPFARGAARFAAVVLFTAFHMALHGCLRLGPFSYVAIAVWAAFLPSFVWDALGAALSKRAWTRRLAHVAARWSPPARSSPIQLNSHKIQVYLQRAAWALSLAALFFILWANAGVILNERLAPPRALLRASLGFGLSQEWGMFAPGPPEGDTWLVFQGTLEGGREVDALGDGAPIDWNRPFPSPFPGSPGENYMNGVLEPLYKEERHYLARWICRRWDAAHPRDPLRAITIRVILQRVTLPGSSTPPKLSQLLWEQPCAP